MKYYKLECASLPDALFNAQASAKEWLSLATTSDGKFKAGSLSQVLPIERVVEVERIVGISAWLAGNVMPFALPPLLLASLLSDIGMALLKFVAVYFASLLLINKYYFLPYFTSKYNRPTQFSDNVKDNQYLYTERNNQKYTSLKFVWPESIHRPALDDKPVIFCAIPHGAAPLGITSYPMWSKLFNDRLCRWTCAPVVLKIPVIKSFMRSIGYIPAKSSNIIDTLTKKEENVGIILDGIAGMFHGHDEIAHVKKRKGIIKIALRAGAPIIPVYGFGHTSLWRVVTDPFGILESLSVKLDVSICPFFGRFGWFLGPPRRVAVCVCMGQPIMCPKMDEPSKEDIDKYHGELLKGYDQLFEQHKQGYGWGDKELKFV